MARLVRLYFPCYRCLRKAVLKNFFFFPFLPSNYTGARPWRISQHEKPTIVGTDGDELSDKIDDHITELINDRRFGFQQRWQTGD